MKAKTIVRLSVDFLMTIFLLLLMGYQFWGETAHEWVGAGMFLLFITHHILNGSWYKNLFRGRYPAVRILTLSLDALLLLAMLAQMYSGIVMTRYVFDFLPISGGMLLARRLHILGSYWGFLLMSLHLGLHWNMILGMLRKVMQIKSDSKVRRAAVRAAGCLAAGYGCYVFIKREFPTYLLLKSEFVFLDYSESKILFYLDYLALMGLCIFLAHYGGRLLSAARRKRGR